MFKLFTELSPVSLASVAECLRVLTSNYLPVCVVGLNPNSAFGFFHVRKLYNLLTERRWFYSGATYSTPLRIPKLAKLKLFTTSVTLKLCCIF
jgi:hypothetical protein